MKTNAVPASDHKADVARANGSKSKGPITLEGKARSSQNAVTHGIYTRAVVLQNEDESEYLRLRANYLREYSPVGERESDLADDIVNARWRLHRIVAMETSAIDLEMDRQRGRVSHEFELVDEATRATIAFASLSGNNQSGLDLIARAENHLIRTMERAAAQLERLQTSRRKAADLDPLDQPEATSQQPFTSHGEQEPGTIGNTVPGSLQRTQPGPAAFLSGAQSATATRRNKMRSTRPTPSCPGEATTPPSPVEVIRPASELAQTAVRKERKRGNEPTGGTPIAA